MRKLFLSTILLLMPLLSQAQLLKGKIIGSDIKKITVEYTPTDDLFEREYRDTPVKDGVFTFDADIPGESTDV